MVFCYLTVELSSVLLVLVVRLHLPLAAECVQEHFEICCRHRLTQAALSRYTGLKTFTCVGVKGQMCLQIAPFRLAVADDIKQYTRNVQYSYQRASSLELQEVQSKPSPRWGALQLEYRIWSDEHTRPSPLLVHGEPLACTVL